eukprot:311476-Chlamydomonas_euryale.AAC.1
MPSIVPGMYVWLYHAPSSNPPASSSDGLSRRCSSSLYAWDGGSAVGQRLVGTGGWLGAGWLGVGVAGPAQQVVSIPPIAGIAQH